jgi:hypothetical protein
MVFVFLGVALVWVEILAFVGRLGNLDLPTWARLVVPLLVLAVCWLRWPGERMPWTLMTAATLLVFNRTALAAAGWLAPSMVVGIGIYLAAYGWKTRKTARVGPSRLSLPVTLFAWGLIVLIVAYVLGRP